MIASSRSVPSPRQTRLRLAALFYLVARLLLLVGLAAGPMMIWGLGWPPVPVGTGVAGVVGLGFLVAYLVARPVRCVVCSQPSLARSSQPKHPYATKWLGFSYPGRVAWDVLTASHHHCMYCHTRCRNRAYADQTLTATETRFRQPEGRLDFGGVTLPPTGPLAAKGTAMPASTIFEAALLAPDGGKPPVSPGEPTKVASGQVDPRLIQPAALEAAVPPPLMPSRSLPVTPAAPPLPFEPILPLGAGSALPATPPLLAVPAFPFQSAGRIAPPVPASASEGALPPPLPTVAPAAPFMPSAAAPPIAVASPPSRGAPELSPVVEPVQTSELSPFFGAMRPPVPTASPTDFPALPFVSEQKPMPTFAPPVILPTVLPPPPALPGAPVGFPPQTLAPALVFPLVAVPSPFALPPVVPVADDTAETDSPMKAPSEGEGTPAFQESPALADPFWLTQPSIEQTKATTAATPGPTAASAPILPPAAVLSAAVPPAAVPLATVLPSAVSMEAVIRVLQQGQETMEAAFRSMIDQLQAALAVEAPPAPAESIPQPLESAPSGELVTEQATVEVVVPFSPESEGAPEPTPSGHPMLSPLGPMDRIPDFPDYPPLFPVEPSPLRAPTALVPPAIALPPLPALPPQDIPESGATLAFTPEEAPGPVRRRSLPALPTLPASLMAELGPTLAQAFIPAGGEENAPASPPEPPLNPPMPPVPASGSAGVSPFFSLPTMAVPAGNSFVPGPPMAGPDVPPSLTPAPLLLPDEPGTAPMVPPPFSFLQSAQGTPAWPTDDLEDLPTSDGPPMWTRSRGKPFLS